MSLPPKDGPDPEALLDLTRQRMPFGKYKGVRLIDLPEAYLAWFARQGFPRGRLGMLLSTALEVKSNGLADLVRRVRTEPRDPP